MRTMSRPIALAAIVALAGAAQAHEVIYIASLSGPNEAPPNTSPGIGFSTLTIDLDTATMHIEVDFSGLLGTVTASHIHGPTVIPFEGTASVMTPVPSFPGFPHGGTSGSYAQSFDLTSAGSYNPAFVTANGGSVGDTLNAFLLALEEGRAYLNIHSTMFPAGEIRGFYTLVPAPGALAVLGVAGLATARRRR